MAITRSPYWRMTYAADRRKHRHRCACGCNTIIQPGTPVFMARTSSKRTLVMREDHAAIRCAVSGFTNLERLEAWGMAYLADCGDPAARKFVQTAPICCVGGTGWKDGERHA